ncbi:MAG: UDP-N-acetylmuramoyl-L-alanine--D-glutamate ligase [Candidatus Gribaldobacteria bacterium]|nr:UDP-N-acetylmuramoyl-L-alanine--D-glutamate ligase [Candidatus Gribaldobacteria bacterium]
MKLENLENKNILILGLGKEGIDSYLALRKIFPHKILAVADKKELKYFDKKVQTILAKDKNLKKYFGNNYLNKAGEYDLIIKAPGISCKELGSLQTTSQAEIFFDNFPGLIIGVTGTKGKGTTSGLIYQILKTARLKAFFLGNVGNPVMQYLLNAKPDHIAVYEISAQQLRDLKKSPQIAVFLNLFSDHLDYFTNFQEYAKAKANIAIHQTKNDLLVYNGQEPLVKKIASQSKARQVTFNKAKLKIVENIINLKEIPLQGEFNYLNVLAAVLATTPFNIQKEKIKKAIKTFQNLPHRLEFVGKYQGIEFYNNSMATVPETTILDLKTFSNKKISLIIGGSDKGSDYSLLAKEIAKSSVKNLIILGQGTGQKIVNKLEGGNLLPKRKEVPSFQAQSMEEAVRICYQQTPKDGICLLSPASASFNMFKDYQNRGEQFKKWVKKYGQKSN